jgi:hypothetical protein
MSIPSSTKQPSGGGWNGTLTANITNLVRDWYDGGILNYGLATSDTDTSTGYVALSAHEAGFGTAPKLAVTYHLAPIPEPAEWAMLLAGLVVIGFIAQRRREFRFE